MKLVSDWRDAWRWFSVHALALAGVLPGAWEALPQRWQDVVPVSWVATAAAVTAALGIYGRLVDQGKQP